VKDYKIQGGCEHSVGCKKATVKSEQGKGIHPFVLQGMPNACIKEHTQTNQSVARGQKKLRRVPRCEAKQVGAGSRERGLWGGGWGLGLGGGVAWRTPAEGEKGGLKRKRRNYHGSKTGTGGHLRKGKDKPKRRH